jgi:hydrogenase nickel incorporation protein HypA/HybF
MHELGIAQEIVEICARRAGAARVARVALEIGQHALIVPDSIRFCFDLCSEGTALEGATLEINHIPGRAQCRFCGEPVALDQPFATCSCGSSDLEWLSGDEIKIKEMEVV